jgi:hypothetical protein
MSTASNDPQELQFVAAFSDALAKAGWSPGRDVELVIRWGAGDVARMVANARELVALSPDVMLVKGGPTSGRPRAPHHRCRSFS